MTTAADLAAQIENLRQCRAKGVLRVRDTSGSGHVTEVEYRSDAELAAAISDLERRLAGLRGSRIRTVRINSLKGL